MTTLQLFGSRVEGDWLVAIKEWAAANYVKTCYNSITTRERFSIMNRQRHGEHVFIDPRSVMYALTAPFTYNSHLNSVISNAATAFYCLPHYNSTWTIKEFRDRIINILHLANLLPIDKLAVVLLYHYAERFENEIATKISKAKRPNVVFTYGTFYLWVIDKTFITLTGAAPTLMKNRIANYLKKFPHPSENDNGVTFQMTDIIPVISWLEKEGIAVQIDMHPHRDMSGTGSSMTGDWLDPASGDFDPAILPWFVFDSELNLDMVRFDNILDQVLLSRYGKRTVPREGLQFWRIFGSLDIEKFDIFSPQGPENNLNNGTPAGESNQNEKSFDMSVFTKLELMFNFNTAGHSGLYDNGDRPVFVNDLAVAERMLGLSNEKVWFAPEMFVSANVDGTGVPTATLYNDIIANYTNMNNRLITIDANNLNRLDVMIEANRNNLKVLSANMGAQFTLVKDKLEEIGLVEFIKSGLNNGSESPEKHPELANFFRLESTVQSLIVQGGYSTDFFKHPFRQNWFMFEGLFNNGDIADVTSLNLLGIFDKDNPTLPNVPAFDIFWQPKIYGNPLVEDEVPSTLSKWYYQKSFIDNYIAKVPKSLQFTILYLLGKSGNGFADPDDLTNLCGSLNKNNSVSNAKPTSESRFNTLLCMPAAGGAIMSGISISSRNPNTSLPEGLDISQNKTYGDGSYYGDNYYSVMTFQTFIDGYNYRNLGTGFAYNSAETRRFRVARAAHDNVPACNQTGGLGILTAVDFQDASWSFSLKSFVDEYLSTYYTKRMLAVQTSTLLKDTSQFEYLYVWYDRFAIKKLFPGVFAFGLPVTTPTNTRLAFQLLFRSLEWNSLYQVPGQAEAWINLVTEDNWISDVEYVSKVLPNLYQPIEDFINLADQV